MNANHKKSLEAKKKNRKDEVVESARTTRDEAIRRATAAESQCRAHEIQIVEMGKLIGEMRAELAILKDATKLAKEYDRLGREYDKLSDEAVKLRRENLDLKAIQSAGGATASSAEPDQAPSATTEA